MDFLSLSRRHFSSPNVPSGEERGETDVFAGWFSFHFQCKRSIFLLQTAIKGVCRHPFSRVLHDINYFLLMETAIHLHCSLPTYLFFLFFHSSYALMCQCWVTEPERRPSFDSIGKTIKRLQQCHKVVTTCYLFVCAFIN